MKTRTSLASALAASVSVATVLFAGLIAATPAAHAEQTKDTKETPDFAITVSAFHDAGGATYKGPDGKPLTERLALALRKYLADGAHGRYAVADLKPSDSPKDAPRFTVEGDLSALQVGDPDPGPYMLVTRVFREDKPRKLVAQFAGTARSLRDLTGNMTGQTSVSRLGLAGELAKEIADAAQGSLPMAEAFNDMVEKTTATRRVTVDVVGDNGDNQKPRQTVTAGERFRLRVNSQDAGQVYIVALDPTTKRPLSPYAQTEPLDVAVGRPVVLPPNEPFVAPQVTFPTTVEYLVFVRRHTSDKEKDKGTPAATALLKESSSMVASAAPIAPRTFAAAPDDSTKSSPIELLSCVPPSNGLDSGVANLLSLYKGDADASWTGVRVKIAVTPSGSPVVK